MLRYALHDSFLFMTGLFAKSFWSAGCYPSESYSAPAMQGKDLFNFGPVFGYYFRKKDASRKNNFNMKTMHFINKLSLAMFLFCLVVMLFRYVIPAFTR